MKIKYLTYRFVVLSILLGIVLTADDIFWALKKATDINFARKSEEENAARILKWNLKRCQNVIYTGHEYGEGTMTVKCSIGKAYLLSHNYSDSDFLQVYNWNIEEIELSTLERK